MQPNTLGLLWFNVNNCALNDKLNTPQTYFVTLSMICTWTLECVCARTASCCAHFRHRPPTRLECVAETRDFWCFSLPSKSLHVFWDSERSFLERNKNISAIVKHFYKLYLYATYRWRLIEKRNSKSTCNTYYFIRQQRKENLKIKENLRN